jgi:hypothetical protein
MPKASKESNAWAWAEYIPVLGILVLAGGIAYWLTRFDIKWDEQPGLTTFGQLGDTFGGMLNPYISLIALFWLIRSVRIQRTEMAETKSALESSAEAQLELTNQAMKQTRIAALTALISSSTAEISILQSNIHFLLNQEDFRKGNGARDQDGTWLDLKIASSRVTTLDKEVKRELARQEKYENELRELLLILTIEQSPE